VVKDASGTTSRSNVMARPTLYTPELARVICERIAQGETLKAVCEDEAMPDRRTVYRWVVDDEEFCHLYAKAREQCADSWFEEAINVSREAAETSDPKFVPGSRLYVDTLKWAAAKLRPRQYSDKHQVEMSGPDGGPIQLEEMAKDARERLASRITGIAAAKGASELPGEPE
jgi:hypothetical protein